MSLTGVSLIVVAVLAMAATATGTVLLWSRSGRRRLVGRTAGILLTEVLLVFSAGLIANRAELFYPSWQALVGRTGAAATSAARVAGRLDATLHTRGAATMPWRPPGVALWHLAAAPTLVVPAGYVDRQSVMFPVVVDLAGGQPVADAVAVRLSPTGRTSVTSLASLSEDLARDVRVTSRGWAIVAPMAEAVFAAELVRSVPGRFVALALVGDGRPPSLPIPVAVVRAHHRGRPSPAGTTELTGSGARAWTVASAWAAGQTSPPLAAPVQLPAAQTSPPLAAPVQLPAGPVPPHGRDRS